MIGADAEEFKEYCLLFDIEINEKNVIYSLGGVFGDEIFSSPPGKTVIKETLEKLNSFGQRVDFLLGHDIPHLIQKVPSLALLEKRAIDTLSLSPLAYPANSYHRLVKNYQIVRDSINEPVQDAKLAGMVFACQLDAFISQLVSGSDFPVFYRSFL